MSGQAEYRRAAESWGQQRDTLIRERNAARAEVQRLRTVATITTAEELGALPHESVLRGAGKGYDLNYVVVMDLGDGEVLFYATDEMGALEADEVIERHGPLVLIHSPATGA